jgi:ATP-binding cassette subfamily F protein uup
MAAGPRNLVSAEGLGKRYAGRVVLDGVSLGVAAGDRIGVVGPNGGGKSTLVGLLARRADPDAGTVVHATGLTVGLLTQDDELHGERTIRDVVIQGRADHEWAGDRRIRDVLDGLLGGVAVSRFPQGLDTQVAPLSGGERRRIALARLLLDAPELLVLDEPTNHLDLEGVAWLAEHLAARRGTLLMVTHDRWFLDAVCTATWEVSEGQVRAYDGGYAAYVLARAERERVAAAVAERRHNLLRKELAWLRRGPPARTSKPRFRIEAANALIDDEPPPRDRVELLRFAGARLGKSVYDVEDVTLEVGGRRLLQRTTWRLGPGDRVALVGRNGAGKTSFLRLLRGELEPVSGRVGVGVTVRVATLAQEIDEVDPELRVLEALEAVRPRVDLGKGRELTASQLCERFGFGGTRQWTFVRDLSGGERRRLQLMRLLMGEPNVLLLDEPTNDLDIDTLTALEDLLDGWPGSLVVVSHDRFFVERVCDDVYGLVGDGGIRHLPGGVDTYLQLVRERDAAAAPPPAQPATGAGVPKGAAIREAKRAAQRLERELERLERRRSELHDALAEHATDYERVVELDRELREAEAELERLEEAWLEASTTADG